VRVEVEGIADAVRALERYGEAATREASREIVDGALAVQREAKRNTPVDTGRLRNSIAAASVETELHAVSRQATQTSEAPNRLHRATLTAVVGTNVEYAEPVHFGARGTAPSPFLFSAFEAERPKVYDRMKEALIRARREVERG
jgi:HK97 gp10 family phage protein